jgi:hypothetical protein
MAGHADLGVYLMPTLQVASIGKESEEQAYEKD